MIEKITNQNQIARHKLAEKINEIIDWINEVSGGTTIVDKQVTANLPNIDAGELAYLQKENSDLKDEVEKLQKMFSIAKNGLVYMQENVLEYAADYMDYADDVLEEIKELDNE